MSSATVNVCLTIVMTTCSSSFDPPDVQYFRAFAMIQCPHERPRTDLCQTTPPLRYITPKRPLFVQTETFASCHMRPEALPRITTLGHDRWAETLSQMRSKTFWEEISSAILILLTFVSALWLLSAIGTEAQHSMVGRVPKSTGLHTKEDNRGFGKFFFSKV